MKSGHHPRLKHRLRGEGLWWVITREILPNAWAPLEWGYIGNALAAAQSIAATAQRVTFCGHVHEPALYHSQPEGGARHFAPRPGVKWPSVSAVMAHDTQISAAGR